MMVNPFGQRGDCLLPMRTIYTVENNCDSVLLSSPQQHTLQPILLLALSFTTLQADAAFYRFWFLLQLLTLLLRLVLTLTLRLITLHRVLLCLLLLLRLLLSLYLVLPS